ncbi:3-oxo-tetronate kinase [Mycolicibacterium brisbanense]
MIGVIADDFTGATDVAVAFRRAGLHSAILFGVGAETVLPDNDVTIVALKTRTIPAAEAVMQSLHALEWLRQRGARQIFFKYCSTFDSRPQGNIGPVADALADALDANRVVFVPASPEHLRTQYMGHLFVDGVLLSDSPMKDHPLTPMTQSHLPTVLGRQTQHDVGLIGLTDVRCGSGRIAARLDQAQQNSTRYVLVDALDSADLIDIGTACLDDVLVTGAAGLAGGLGAAYSRRHIADFTTRDIAIYSAADELGVVLAGSCSARTLEQLDHMKRAGHPWLQLTAAQSRDAKELAEYAIEWYDRQQPTAGPVIYSSAPPDDLRCNKEHAGNTEVSGLFESAMGLIARGLTERGVTRLVVAGGETSGAVVTALGLTGGVIGEEEAVGVPWIHATDRRLSLLLKSGNFGDRQLLSRAVKAVTR